MTPNTRQGERGGLLIFVVVLFGIASVIAVAVNRHTNNLTTLTMHMQSRSLQLHLTRYLDAAVDCMKTLEVVPCDGREINDLRRINGSIINLEDLSGRVSSICDLGESSIRFSWTSGSEQEKLLFEKDCS